MVFIFLLIFTVITWWKFRAGLALLFLLLPTYLIRFQIGPLPTTALEDMLLILLLFWLKKHLWSVWPEMKLAYAEHKGFFLSALLFLLGATIALFTGSDLRAAAGEWKAFYIEPALLAFVLWIEIKKDRSILQWIVWPLLLSGFATALLAIYQHFTGWLVPHAFWANNDTYRVTAWYGFPNGVGLFLSPLILLGLLQIKTIGWTAYKKPLWVALVLFVLCALLGIIWAKSTGGLIGVLAGLITLLLLHKRARALTIFGLCLLASAFALVPWEHPVKQELLLQDRSGQIRVSMWEDTVHFLQDHPVTGAGLASFSEAIQPYHSRVNGERVEIFHHPHNLILTTWVNTGLLGLLGFVGMLIALTRTLHTHKKKLSPEQCYWIAALVVIWVAGLVDSPYIKNDLAMLYWLVVITPLALLPKRETR